MKPYALLLLGLVGVTSGSIWFFAMRLPGPTATAPLRPVPLVEPAPVPTLTAPSAVGPSPGPAPAVAIATELAPEFTVLVDPTEARRRVGILLLTQDPAIIPELGAYLRHSDEAVRGQAAEALIQLDDARAVPFLRGAAEWEARQGRARAAVKLESTANFLVQAPPDRPRPPVRSLEEASREWATTELVEMQKAAEAAR